MTVFRWVFGVFTLLLASGAALSFVIFLLQDRKEWLVLARRFRHWTWTACLFWFNLEIWGRVLYTLVHWRS